MNFRLTSLLYLFALVAASLAASGPVGVLAVVGVLLFWAGWLYFPRLTRPTWLLWSVVLGVPALLTLPAMQLPRETGTRNSCLNNIKQLLLAIQNYDDTHGQLPPVYGKIDRQKAPQSWRVHLLPFMEGSMVARDYNFDEPWDGPMNKKQLANLSIDTHECIEHASPGETNYFAISGPQTAWGDGDIRTFDDVTDGLSNTIMLIEASGRGVHWSEPKDLTFDEAVELLTSPLPTDDSDGHRIDHGYFFKPTYVRLVALCDGSARALSVPIPRQAAVALLTSSGGEKTDPKWLEYRPAPQLNYSRVGTLLLFSLLAILPAVAAFRPWIWPTITTDIPTEPEPSPLDK